MEKWEKSLAVTVALFLIIFIALAFYENYRQSQIEDALKKQGESLSKQLDELKVSQEASESRLTDLVQKETGSVRKDLDVAKSGLQSRIQQVGQNVEGVKKETEKSKQILSGQIQSIQQESQQKMGEIEQQLLNVNVKTENFAGIIQKAIKSVVAINSDVGIGSGVIIDQDGYIVTNRHVIEGATQGSAKTADGAHHQIRVVAKSDSADLALLQIQGSYAPLNFGTSNSVAPGSRVVAMGSPAGLEFTVTEGIVSAKRRIGNFDYIQTDLSMNPGNSGGPLINPRGDIVGINTLKLKEFEGLGFALASEQASDFALPLIEADKKARSGQ